MEVGSRLQTLVTEQFNRTLLRREKILPLPINTALIKLENRMDSSKDDLVKDISLKHIIKKQRDFNTGALWP
jgi:hypothetical protein